MRRQHQTADSAAAASVCLGCGTKGVGFEGGDSSCLGSGFGCVCIGLRIQKQQSIQHQNWTVSVEDSYCGIGIGITIFDVGGIIIILPWQWVDSAQSASESESPDSAALALNCRVSRIGFSGSRVDGIGLQISVGSKSTSAYSVASYCGLGCCWIVDSKLGDIGLLIWQRQH